MSARYAQNPAVVQDVLRQPLRAGNVRQVAVEDFLHQRVAARYHVADDVDVRIQFQLLDAPAFDQFYALRFELGAHRRIDVGVAAGDAMACLAGNGGDAAHEGAADAENVDVLRCLAHA